jgi:hypothetical protein
MTQISNFNKSIIDDLLRKSHAYSQFYLNLEKRNLSLEIRSIKKPNHINDFFDYLANIFIDLDDVCEDILNI